MFIFLIHSGFRIYGRIRPLGLTVFRMGSSVMAFTKLVYDCSLHCFSRCYTSGIVGVVVEAPFPPFEVLQDLVVLYGRQEVKALLYASTWVQVGVKLLAPSEVG